MSGLPQNTEDMTIRLGRRLTNERERLIGMTDEERAWRAQFLKDQILDPSEPITPSDYYKETNNPIKRFYRAPFNIFENMLVPLVGPSFAKGLRYLASNSIITIIFIYSACYYCKYNKHEWIKPGSWRISYSRIKQFPSDPGFPNTKIPRKGNEFATFGFEKSPI